MGGPGVCADGRHSRFTTFANCWKGAIERAPHPREASVPNALPGDAADVDAYDIARDGTKALSFVTPQKK